MSRDYGSLTLHDLPDWEADEIRQDAYDAAHPRCEACDARICLNQSGCGCTAEVVVDQHDRELMFCSAKCYLSFGAVEPVEVEETEPTKVHPVETGAELAAYWTSRRRS